MADELTADEIRTLLKLEPHATCRFVRITYLSPQSIAAGGLPPPFSDRRPMGSALHFIVTPTAPVRLHRIRNDHGAAPLVPWREHRVAGGGARRRSRPAMSTNWRRSFRPSPRTCAPSRIPSGRIRFGSGRQRRAHFPRLLHHPRAVARERGDAGEPAAAFAQRRAGRPAHHADHRQRAADVAIDRRAGIAGTGAESGALAFGGGVSEPDLQRAGLAGGDKRGGAHRAARLASAAPELVRA